MTSSLGKKKNTKNNAVHTNHMRKIGEFIYEMDTLLGVKTAFVPAPQQGGDPSQGGGGQDPSQGQGGQDPNAQLMQQVMQMVQSLPPEVQQQVAPQLQQVQQMPPDQQGQALQQLAQGLQQMQGGQGGDPSQQGGDPTQGGGGAPPGDPSQAGQMPGDPSQGQTSNPDGSANTAGHAQAENQLDNTKVTLSVRELMDITSGGKASDALFKVKHLAHQHNAKMQGLQQKQQQDAAQAQMQQQQAAQGMGGGGIYAQAPDMSGKNSTPGGM